MEGNNVIHTGGSRMTSNVLRCCATLFVFLLHGRSNVPALANATGIWQWITFLPAWGGVWIFFFLSGFGIGILNVHCKCNRRKKEKRDTRERKPL